MRNGKATMSNAAIINQHKRAYFEFLKTRRKIIDRLQTKEAYFSGDTLLVGNSVFTPLLETFRRQAIELRNANYRMRLANIPKQEYDRTTQWHDFSDIVPNWMAKYRSKQFYFDEVERFTWNADMLAMHSKIQHTGWNQLLFGMQNEKNRLVDFEQIREGRSRDAVFLHNIGLMSQSVNHSGTVAVDIETTSFSPLTGEIIEIGIVHWPAGTEYNPETLERFSIRFGLSNENAVLLGTGPVEIHGITSEMIEGKEPISNSLAQSILRHYLCSGKRIIAHNLAFETKWLTVNVPSFFESNFTENGVSTTLVDSGLLPKGFLDNPVNAKLEALVEHTGFEYFDAHSAMPDAMMTMLSTQKVFEEMAHWGEQGLRMPLKNPKSSSEMLGDYRTLITTERAPANVSQYKEA